MIKLIATDIDGTILRYDFVFNPEIKACIKKLSNEGVKVVLVTGRMYSSTRIISKELGLETPIVSYQGGLIKDCSETLYERHLDAKSAGEVIEWVRENDIHANLYLNDELFVEKDSETVKRYVKQGVPGYHVKSFDDVKLENINKMILINYEDANKVTSWEEYLKLKYPNLNIIKSTPYYCEICHKEATKFHSVDFLTNHWGLKKEEVMTIGDQNNDLDLLRAGGVKVAMGNATDELKAIADYVTDTVENNGFVKAVERFVYNESKI